MVADNLMRQVVNINRPTASKSDWGAETDSYSTVYSSIACSIQPVSAAWQVIYAQKKINVSNTIYFNTNPNIENGDQIVYGSRTYYVESIRNLLEIGRMVEVDVRELK